MTVLDASAVLAVLNDEPGADVVVRAMLAGGTSMSAANLAEVLGKVVDVVGDVAAVTSTLGAAGVEIVPLDAQDAAVVAALRSVDGGKSLSLGDRCAIALAARSRPSVVLTADRAWADLDLPIQVELIR
ncbi:PIN domain-containing protein [Rhodococcoides kyotonense]|uniref:PIN domain nuclease, a component of toxin-antitoxin system (PIN domain) n=1 Tax=Rhodococcoides kyotonense TaxID=398843 RepID=A0A239M748_9NOCA|nr:PIN domain-containing protein [Rhodococcus kyotonensis]SNT38546.1 PIN domain nuclease, a component of toxin-antitoxin system (PIN domain) [Rhodococcus kyotonensis]